MAPELALALVHAPGLSTHGRQEKKGNKTNMVVVVQVATWLPSWRWFMPLASPLR